MAEEAESYPVLDNGEKCGVVYPVHNGWHAMAEDFHGMSGGPGWNRRDNAYKTRGDAEAATRTYWREKRNS